MDASTQADAQLARRAGAWRRSKLRQVCDALGQWEFGTIARAGRHPDYYDYNLLLVERATNLNAESLSAMADELLAGLKHRRLDVEDPGEASRLRPGLEKLGWRSTVLVWMHHTGLDVEPAAVVSEVDYDAVYELRLEWIQEDLPGTDYAAFYPHAREVELARGARVLAVLERGVPVAYAQLEEIGDASEVAEVFVTKRLRGRGLGTAVTSSAIAAAGARSDVWICADDEDRPKLLYQRLGFRPVWWVTEFLRLSSG